jgi:hypothetical protein
MKHAPLFVALFLTACAAPPQTEKGSVHLTIPADRVAECEMAGGCAFLSKAELAAAMQQAYRIGAEQGAQEAMQRLDSHGCKRGST